MLRENIKQHLRQEKKLRDDTIEKKPMSGRERQLYHRAKKDALKGIEDLTFLLETLPEKQLDEIFNAEIMLPFFNALLSTRTKINDKSKVVPPIDKNRLKRIKSLWSILLLRDASYCIDLVGRDIWQAITSTPDNSLRALYYALHYGARTET